MLHSKILSSNTRNNMLTVPWKLLQRLFYCFPAPWLAKVELSQKSNGMWFFSHFFAPCVFHCSRNYRRDKLRSKFWREKMFRKPHLKLLRWFSVHGTNKWTMFRKRTKEHLSSVLLGCVINCTIMTQGTWYYVLRLRLPHKIWITRLQP